jgi:dipeptidyl aminopeptidase/acylaminoacyl peptidase
MMNRKKPSIFAAAALLLLLLIIPASPQNQETRKQEIEQTLTSWLILGPIPTPLPAFHTDEKKGFPVDELLKFKEIDISQLKPKTDTPFTLHNGTPVQWKKIEAGEKGVHLEWNIDSPSLAYLGAYVDIARWTLAKITVTSPHPFKVYLDGKVAAEKNRTEKNQEGNASGNLILETGKHLLLIKTLFDPDENSNWTVSAAISFNESYSSPAPVLSVSHEERMTIKHLLDGPKVTGVSISTDGTLAALSKRQTLPPSDDSESWLEIYQLPEGRLLHTFRGGMSISRVNWAPFGKIFSYTSRNNSGSTIWIVDLAAGTSIPILKDIKDLGSHVWSPDGSFIIYSVTEKGKPDVKGVKRFQNMSDRQPQWRDRSYLYKLTVPGGMRQRLTAGKLSTYLHSISPDGKKLLFTRPIVDYSERPYSKTELYTLDLKTLIARMLWKGKWFGSAQWGPEGKELLVIGGPSVFGEIGQNVPEGMIPNEYDNQAYLYDTQTKRVRPISKLLNPSINQAYWCHELECIYFTATDRSFRRLYRYDLNRKEFSVIDCGVEILHQFDASDKKPVAVYIGSSAASPPKAFFLDTQKREWNILHDPGKEDFADVKFGDVKRWIFKNKKDRWIEGRVYYPPDFNKSKKYPCIVYYYGGTSPVTREFGGRYPKNLYAAQGYIVYVLQPSGATGFGQEFSALHVNDWGLIVADEIIDGVRKFLDAHPFVDPKRIGCMGASYGGFMTMTLLTRTDLFASAISHAGISSISSYWGEGYWGYLYSAIATANSFPWNRKDIYLDQSALFNADKISTPLLLLHGSVDTNVPPGESTQLFTALKLLGKEVEYIQIMDQNHHILTYNKRKIWTKTIMAWFDKWLKNQPEWWSSLYSEK